MKCFYKINAARSYPLLLLCVCACAKCMLKLCMVMYNYVCIKFMSNGTKSLTLKYFVVKNFLPDIPSDENILQQNIFTQRYPKGNFSQTTESEIG